MKTNSEAPVLCHVCLLPESENPFGLEDGSPVPDEEDSLQLQDLVILTEKCLTNDNVSFDGSRFEITNDPDCGDVNWERTADGYAIHLCAESAQNWSQVVYQLGYAMTRCLIDHTDPDGQEVRWAEQLISEMMAIKVLLFASDNWESCRLSEDDPDYGDYFSEEAMLYLKDEGTSALLRCQDEAGLAKLNEDDSFGDRLDESHDLFLRYNDEDLEALTSVRQYAQNKYLLDTEQWRKDYPDSLAVSFICRLQEKAMQ